MYQLHFNKQVLLFWKANQLTYILAAPLQWFSDLQISNLLVVMAHQFNELQPTMFFIEIIKEKEKETSQATYATLNIMKNLFEILKWILICPKWEEAHNNHAFCYTCIHISKDIDIYLSIFRYIYIVIRKCWKDMITDYRESYFLCIIIILLYSLCTIFRVKSNIPLFYFGKYTQDS